ncbi:hypothetical protein C2E23DRAFT_411217 [Lenzites betulinus]|nr:hypothetical protein C2E23DRAFT_411217 [Lenzites betulinus]
MATDGSIASLAARIRKLRTQCNELEIKSSSSDELFAIEEDLGFALASVRRECNSRRTLPSKLPAELLITVFLHALDKKPVVELRDTWEEFLYAYSETPRPVTDFKTLMSITHVCHLWRSAAVSSPLLWNHIPPGPRNISRLFAERSGSHIPLTLYDNTAEPQDRTLSQDGWRDLLWPRLHGLVICASGQSAMPKYSRDNMQTLAQSLRYLRILSDSQYSDIGAYFPKHTKMRLFRGEEALALKAFEFSLSAGAIYLDRFPVLAHLVIAHNEGHNIQFSVKHLLGLLANMPALETLRVRECQFYDLSSNPTPTANWATVHLNRLRVGVVGISCHLAAIVFAERLRVPPTCMLEINRILVRRYKRPKFETFRNTPLNHFHILEVIIDEAEKFEVHAFRESGGGLKLRFSKSCDDSKPLYTLLLAPVIAALGPTLSTVKTLRVRSLWEGNDPKAGLLATVLAEADRHIDALAELAVLSSNDIKTRFVVAHAPTSPAGERGLPAPALTTIFLKIMDEDIPEVCEQLVALLKERAAQGHRVEVIRIRGSNNVGGWEVETKEGEERLKQLQDLVLHSGGVWYNGRRILLGES